MTEIPMWSLDPEQIAMNKNGQEKPRHFSDKELRTFIDKLNLIAENFERDLQRFDTNEVI